MAPRTTSRPILREALLAALVLALVFLNFGHSTALAGVAYGTDSSWCGDPLSPDPAAHASCHACRVGEGAALPPPPLAAISVAQAAFIIDYPEAAWAILPDQTAAFAQPRAPPLV